MVVAKRQRREKPMKWNKGRSQDQGEDSSEMGPASWLAQFTQDRRRGRRKSILKKEPGLSLRPLLFVIFWVSSPSHS